ncbi:MAG TPA: hypothetical protein PK156_42050 [Polyangium sp.]|nr:hypothetical protein [Polyangium sp.]
MIRFVQAGWWIPGMLRSGWSGELQANYNDMQMKLNELGLVPLVQGQAPMPSIGMYYSQAEYDFIQLLTTSDERPQNAQSIVTYSIWLASRNWAGTSPVPILKASDAVEPAGVDMPRNALRGVRSVAGWYLLGSLEKPWYSDIEKNIRDAQEKRAELGLNDCTPLYFTQCASTQTLQMVQSRWEEAPGSNESWQDPNALQQYVNWWGSRGFGSQRPIPFMTPLLLSEALLAAGRAP